MKNRWIIEFDYDADPEDRIETDLTDHLSVTRGPIAVEGNRIVFEHTEDALRTKLRFSQHIVMVERV